MISIRVCMIVKNEEKVLKRCLDSLKKIADEIIIVDTGSTDNTLQIAAHYTNQIYYYKWNQNFSDARNFAFSKATRDYIYSADADEVIDSKNIQRFLTLKAALLPEIEIVQMLYCNQLQFNTTYNYDEEYRPKLFKRLRTFHFIEPIHETIAMEPVVFDSDIRIFHMPESNHASRDLEKFVALQKENTRLSTHLHNMYARELFIAGKDADFIAAIPAFETTLTDVARSESEILEATAVLAHAYRIQKNTHLFFTNVLKNIVCSSCSEICYELGEYYYHLKDMENACVWYQNAAYETECILDIRVKNHYALQGLSNCYRAVGNIEEAARYELLLDNSSM